METGFSQVQEKLRSGEQAQAANRLDLTAWRTDSEAALHQLNGHILEIRGDLEVNRKEHEAMNRELNVHQLHLTSFEEATQLDLKVYSTL